MFWIGLIVGIIGGAAAMLGYVIYNAVSVCGSYEKAAEAGNAIVTANENRESELRVYHNDNCLETVIFEVE